MAEMDGGARQERLLEAAQRHRQSMEVVEVDEARVKVVIFACGAGRYAFLGANVREILTSRPISWLPGLPDFLPGLINVRGDIESVVDLCPLLGLAPAKGGSALIAMAVRGEFRTGILIDAVEDVVDIPPSAILPPLASLDGAAREWVAGEFDHEGALVTLLDLEKLQARIER